MPRYSNLALIGDGSFSDVYKAYDEKLHKIVAVKCITFNDINEGLPGEIIREVSALAELNHPNVVRLLDVEVKHYCCLLIFEYMEDDLAEFIMDHPETSLDPFVIREFLFQILQGIAYCHSKKIVHGDLKPHNLLIDSRRTIKLADFGFAWTVDVPLANYSAGLATLAYSAPELLLGLPYSCGIDIWSVGCIFAELVTQKVLFPKMHDATVMERIVSLFGIPDESDWPEGVSAWRNTLHRKVPKTPTLDRASVFPRLDSEGLDLLKKMLCVNPHRRISAFDALRHPYFKELQVNNS